MLPLWQSYKPLIHKILTLICVNLFYLPEISEGVNHLDEDESRHIIKVLRMEPGDEFTITNGRGFFYQARITSIQAKRCAFEIFEKKQDPKKDFSIHIAIAPTKNIDRIEWFVEKATEIGIDEISFVVCQNSERKTINLERIEKIAISALKQSQQTWLPKLNGIKPLKEILQIPSNQKFIGYVDENNPTSLKSIAIPDKNYLVIIGPEGDFSKEELNNAIEGGFKKISLGDTRLRTETAGLVACHTLQIINS